MNEEESQTNQDRRNGILDFIEKYGPDLKKSGKGPNVERLRGIVPMLLKYIFGEASNKRCKEKGTWLKQPDDWPANIFFGDPNNGKGKNKPKKGDLEPMTIHLLHRFALKEKGIPYHAEIGHPSSVQSQDSEDQDYTSSFSENSTGPASNYSAYPSTPTAIPTPTQDRHSNYDHLSSGSTVSMPVEVVDEDDWEKIVKGLRMASEGATSLQQKDPRNQEYLQNMLQQVNALLNGLTFTNIPEANHSLNTTAVLTEHRFDNATKAQNDGAYQQKQCIKPESEVRVGAPIQETEGKSKKVSSQGQYGREKLLHEVKLSNSVTDPMQLNGAPVEFYSIFQNIQTRPSSQPNRNGPHEEKFNTALDYVANDLYHTNKQFIANVDIPHVSLQSNVMVLQGVNVQNSMDHMDAQELDHTCLKNDLFLPYVHNAKITQAVQCQDELESRKETNSVPDVVDANPQQKTEDYNMQPTIEANLQPGCDEMDLGIDVDNIFREFLQDSDTYMDPQGPSLNVDEQNETDTNMDLEDVLSMFPQPLYPQHGVPIPTIEDTVERNTFRDPDGGPPKRMKMD